MESRVTSLLLFFLDKTEYSKIGDHILVGLVSSPLSFILCLECAQDRWITLWKVVLPIKSMPYFVVKTIRYPCNDVECA